MSLPYHRGHASSTSSSMYRNNANGSGNGSYGGKDRANEVSQTLMEMENNQRWVCAVIIFFLHDLNVT